MGLFNFSKPKSLIAPADLKVELADDSIVINGLPVDIPTHIDALTKRFGKPRKTVYKGKNNINFSWDELGICCYTHNGAVVYCLEIRLNAGEICPKHYPAEFFKGKLLINGMPWLDAVKTAPPTPIAPGEPEFFREIMLGNNSAVAEYVDFMQDELTRTEKDFTTVSVQLKED